MSDQEKVEDPKSQTHTKTKKTRSIKDYYIFIIIGIISLLIAIGLCINYIRDIRHQPFPKPRETDLTLIQEWMTLPYISRTYGVPMPVLEEKLEFDAEQNRNSSLQNIAKKKNESSDQLVSEVQTIISEFQLTHPLQSDPDQ